MRQTHYVVDSFTSQLPTDTVVEEEDPRSVLLAIYNGVGSSSSTSQQTQSQAPFFPQSSSKPTFGTLGRKNYKQNFSTQQSTSTGLRLMNLAGGSATASASDAVWDTIFIPLPRYFVDSRSAEKAVQIELCRVFDFTQVADGQELISSLHSDIAAVDSSADNYIASTNVLYNTPKAYVIGDNRDIFQVWFRKINGDIIDLHPTKTRCIIEMVLRY